uniref:Uncharacterized protein n=1 Tax=Moniliophthora roreri TaxID=221103 RepID=A0A0W0FWR5_MONRR
MSTLTQDLDELTAHEQAKKVVCAFYMLEPVAMCHAGQQLRAPCADYQTPNLI